MPDREKVIRAWELFRESNPYEICNGREFRAFTDPEYCMSHMIEDTIAMLKKQEAIEPILEQDSMVCGVCGHEVIWQKMLGDGIWVDEELNYCPNCGKQVKWK